MGKRIVVALGGNAIKRPEDRGTIEEQLDAVSKTCDELLKMVGEGHEIVITHGNGPQVGALLIQNEEAMGKVPQMPLDVCGAESQAWIGYMIQQTLRSKLKKVGISKDIVTVITQVKVDPDDPAFENPTKPVGPFYTEEQAEKLRREKGYAIREIEENRYRRVVPSPEPKSIVEIGAIQRLVEAGVIVVASGGGGVPVIERGDGRLEGVEAVIDKDLAGEILARETKADIMLFLTNIQGVAIDYGEKSQRFLEKMTLEEARNHLMNGEFPLGTMGPKIRAAIRFLESGGEKAVVSCLENAFEALNGLAGTTITR
ncbi:MAG: carbamate kinase [Candidatus Bathyarchaeia archaeon]